MTRRPDHDTDPTTDPATRPILRGAFTALVTPFTPDGALDEAAFRRLVRWQVLAGIDGLVPCGTTGESPTLSTDERERLIAATVEVVAERAVARPRPGRRRDRHQRHGGHDPRPPAAPPSSAPTRRSSSRPTTTGPTAGCSRRTSGRSPTRATCRSSSTTSRRGPARTSTPTRSCGWPSTRASSRSRRPAATSSRSPGSAATGRATSRSSPATTPGRCRSWRWAATASCRSRRNEIPGELVALCAAARAGDWEAARRTHERWLPLFLANFRGGPNPVPAKAALVLMGLLDTRRGPGAARCRSTPDGRAAMAVTLRSARPRRGRRRPDRAADRDDPRGRRMTPRPTLAQRPRVRRRSTRGRSSTTSRPGASGRPSPTRPRPDGWRVRPGGQGRDPRLLRATGRRRTGPPGR